MPEWNIRRRVPASGNRKTRPPHPSPSPSRRTPPSRRSTNHSKPVRILKRCLSEPMMVWSGSEDNIDQQKQRKSSLWYGSDGGGLSVPRACLDGAFASSPSLIMPDLSPRTSFDQRYKGEAKVVVNVTVEGSPGPVRTMVKLGSSVGDTINLVVSKYGEEGRSPKLDKDGASTYELHHSHFSLRSLDKSELIGDVGSRSFYLRRSYSNRSNSNAGSTVPERSNSPPSFSTHGFLTPACIACKLSKITRRMRKLWKVLVCWK